MINQLIERLWHEARHNHSTQLTEDALRRVWNENMVWETRDEIDRNLDAAKVYRHMIRHAPEEHVLMIISDVYGIDHWRNK